MKTRLILSIFFLSIFLPLTAQNARVISPNGLNMRARPDIYAEKVMAIPFMARLEVLDTVVSTHYQTAVHTFYSLYKDYSYKIPVVGKWLQVQYKGQEGYVFSPFVDVYGTTEFKAVKKLDYRLLMPGEYCYDNIPKNHNDLHWYGLYKKEKGFELRSVDISYFLAPKEMTWLCVSTQNNKDLYLMIGMPKKTKVSTVKGKDLIPEWTDVLWNSKKSFTKGNNELKLMYKNDKPYLQLSSKGIKQSLDLPEVLLSHPMGVNWYGDLDGDGKLDYLIHYGDKVSQMVLYLSSEAEKGKLVKPVAIYYSGYCC